MRKQKTNIQSKAPTSNKNRYVWQLAFFSLQMAVFDAIGAAA